MESPVDYFVKKYSLTIEQSPVSIHGISRNDLAKDFYQLGFVKGAEIGVEKGNFSEVLCKENPTLHLYSIDPWEYRSTYRDYVAQNELDDFYETTKQRLFNYNATIIKGFSLDVVKTFANNDLDFVYIDSNHSFQAIANDIVQWSKKVRIGGIISGHDYKKKTMDDPVDHTNVCDVYEVVNAYTAAKRIHPWFYLADEVSCSWFWIKQ